MDSQTPQQSLLPVNNPTLPPPKPRLPLLLGGFFLSLLILGGSYFIFGRKQTEIPTPPVSQIPPTAFPTVDPTLSWKIFNDSNNKYTFKYPSGLLMSNKSENEILLYLREGLEAFHPENLVFIVKVTISNLTESATLKEQFPQEGSDIIPIKAYSDNMGRIWSIVETDVPGALNFMAELVDEDKLYQVSIQTELKSFTEYTKLNSSDFSEIVKQQKEFSQQILSTFRFTTSSNNNEGRLSCEKKGGEWKIAGIAITGRCFLKTNDGGKTCTDNNQCETICIAPDDVQEGETVTGKCASQNLTLGCNSTLVDGKVQPKLCGD